MPLIGIILGFFSSTGPIVAFFVWIGKSIAVKGVTLGIQFAVVGALVVAKLAFLTTLITLVVYLYNKMDFFFNYLVSISNNSAFVLPIKMLNSIGLIQALVDSLAMFQYVIITMLVLFVSKFVLSSLKIASDEFYKIGMLLNS